MGWLRNAFQTVKKVLGKVKSGVQGGARLKMYMVM